MAAVAEDAGRVNIGDKTRSYSMYEMSHGDPALKVSLTVTYADFPLPDLLP